MAGTERDDDRPRSLSETVAESRRAERLAELRTQRDNSEDEAPDSADRPDLGHRSTATEPGASAHRGRRRGLIGGAVAVVVVAAVVAGYLLLGTHSTPSAQTGPSAAPAASAPARMISKQTMLSADLAGQIVDQSWKVDDDQPAGGDNAPVPACLADAAGAPAPDKAQVRTLTASGPHDPTALHRAQAYRSAEQATAAFAVEAKQLGECDLKGSYISDARVISGLGDEATGIALADPAKHSYRAVVLNRTGRLVNVIDVTEKKQKPDLTSTAQTLGDLTDVQCTTAVGVCASDPSVADGPPPAGGDQPGFLALADLPLPINGKGTWGGLDPGSVSDVTTSGCENVEFSRLPAKSRQARSYILTDKPQGMPETFGLDEITLSMDSAKDARSQAKAIAGNLKSCGDRLPTATVGGVAKISGTGADDTAISGTVVQVDQKVTATRISQYRVGIVAAGDKLVYTFLPRKGDWDFTDGEWKTVTVRAGQRATQIS